MKEDFDTIAFSFIPLLEQRAIAKIEKPFDKKFAGSPSVIQLEGVKNLKLIQKEPYGGNASHLRLSTICILDYQKRSVYSGDVDPCIPDQADPLCEVMLVEV